MSDSWKYVSETAPGLKNIFLKQKYGGGMTKRRKKRRLIQVVANLLSDVYK